MRSIIIIVACLLLFGGSSFSQIKINEILASNASINADPDYNENADWVELYNEGTSAVNLNGYYITDNFNTPDKWQINQNISIAAKGYLLIWTDGKANGLHTNFKISQIGEEMALFSPTLTLIDSVSFGAQFVDISIGRSPNGASTWRLFEQPTPLGSNNTPAYTGRVDNVPEFKLFGGLYPSGVTVEIFTDLGGNIRYTLDGSEPTTGSLAYTLPLAINTTTIVRARVFKTNQIPGTIVTQSYFINEGFESRNLPVVSIATHPNNFWDAEKGIYVQDFKPDWEIPVNIEFFENDGSDRAAFNLQAGIKVNGLYSWQLPQKMLGVYFKKQYGVGSLDYPLFFDRERKSFKSFALRASGSDWSYTMFRDGLIQQACNYNMQLDNMGFRPSVVFVNGQYMGIHNIREKVDEDFVLQNHNQKKGNVDIIENGDYAEAGNLDNYNTFLNTVNKDLSVQSNYDAVAEMMNIENFTDLIITELYDGNTSIDHNVMAWKPKLGGKWEWILMDLDRGFFDSGNNLINFYENQSVWPFSQLLNNTEYKKYFGARLADHLFTTYNPQRIDKRIDYHQNLINDEIPNHVERWLGTTSSYGDAMPSVEYWYNEVAKLKTFANARPLVLLNDLVNYGFSSPALLSALTIPSNAGSLMINDLEIPESSWQGYYPKNLSFTLQAIDKPGYDFIGWANTTTSILLTKKSTWKYLDNGSNQGTLWYMPAFNDGTWSSGAGEFGYGDGDEQTTLSFGSNSSNKYITTYFRKTFNVTNEQLSNAQFTVNLLCDDGAIVYLNGKEVVSTNMPNGTVNYKTPASASINGSAESSYNGFLIDASNFTAGTNIFAVEVHQSGPSSGDLSFDMELVAVLANTADIISNTPTYSTTLIGNKTIAALYAANGQCIIPSVIIENTILNKDCSPYVVQGDVSIPENITLTIEPGVEIFLPPKANFIVNGNIIAIGTKEEQILFKLNPEYTTGSWGALCFENTSDTSELKYVTLEHASQGPVPTHDVAAISAFNSNLILDYMNIENVDYNPIAARYSSVVLTNSKIHSKVTGDLINVKYGKARVENCDFTGNTFPDTDAIDYDDVKNGIIRNVRIHNMLGLNSDAIDIGEQASNITIDSVLICNITDKGISAGQRSTVFVNNCTFVNTTLGLGIKDSSHVQANHCTFYGISTPVACFEKNVGSAGGSANVSNSIMSNSYEGSFLSDNRSVIHIDHCLSDFDTLPANGSNLYGNPRFMQPGIFNLGLGAASPALQTGSDNGTPSDLGSSIRNFSNEPSILIYNIYYNIENNPDRSEFITLYNPTSTKVDLTGYILSQAIDFTFPEGSEISAWGKVFVVKSFDSPSQSYYWPKAWEWLSGSLANEGETIRLTNKNGLIIDQVTYHNETPWPVGNNETVLNLISNQLDNHFGESWSTINYTSMVNDIKESIVQAPRIYPNPTTGMITIEPKNSVPENLEIYSITGELLYRDVIGGTTSVDLKPFNNHLLIIRLGSMVQKVVVLEVY